MVLQDAKHGEVWTELQPSRRRNVQCQAGDLSETVTQSICALRPQLSTTGTEQSNYLCFELASGLKTNYFNGSWRVLIFVDAFKTPTALKACKIHHCNRELEIGRDPASLYLSVHSRHWSSFSCAARICILFASLRDAEMDVVELGLVSREDHQSTRVHHGHHPNNGSTKTCREFLQLCLLNI